LFKKLFTGYDGWVPKMGECRRFRGLPGEYR